ncbi:MAG: sugar kinase [Chloroflexi bacterium]|jgi:sugar/nucleoside kinase (ribokinase family)|nr:sugar kinase [Chloroflexota bacterium]
MMSDFDLLVAGELNPDLILSDPNLEPRFGQHEILVESADLTIGSSSAIFACGAARLGLRVGFVGVVGDDEFGRFMCRSLGAAGVDVSAVVVEPGQRTGLSVILTRGTDRAILTHVGAVGSLRAEQVPASLLQKARHLHVASFFLQNALQPGLADLFRGARGLGLTTSLDTNWDPHEAWTGLKEVLAVTDVFLPNEAEALAITACGDLEAAVQNLSDWIPRGAVKLGAKGALAWRAQERARAAALQVPAVDTVGAGDSFDAGFVFGFLSGWTLQRSLEMAVACGSLSTRAAGGTAAQPTLAEALQHLNEGGHGPAG